MSRVVLLIPLRGIAFLLFFAMLLVFALLDVITQAHAGGVARPTVEASITAPRTATWWAQHPQQRAKQRHECLENRQLQTTAPCLNARAGDGIEALADARRAAGLPTR